MTNLFIRRQQAIVNLIAATVAAGVVFIYIAQGKPWIALGWGMMVLLSLWSARSAYFSRHIKLDSGIIVDNEIRLIDVNDIRSWCIKGPKLQIQSVSLSQYTISLTDVSRKDRRRLHDALMLLAEGKKSAQQGDAPEPGSNVDPASHHQPPRPGDL